MIGGIVGPGFQSVTYKTYTFSDIGNGIWNREAGLIYARESHACGVIKSDFNQGNEMIVVAGGYGEFGNLLDTVEYLTSRNFNWQRGKIQLLVVFLNRVAWGSKIFIKV